MTDRKDYEVGYGKPSRAHQFRKGVCANPKGRGYKKGRATGEQFVRIHTEKIAVEGVAKPLPRFDLAIRQLRLNAVKGNLDAMEMLFNMHADSAKGGDFRGDGTEFVSAERDRILQIVDWGERLQTRRRRRRKRR